MAKTPTKDLAQERRRAKSGMSENSQERRAPLSASQRATKAARRPPTQEERSARRSRRALTFGSALLLLGLAMVGVDSSNEGAVITLIGILIMIYGIHTFGRLGPDEPPALGRAGT